jgi:protein TonB
MKATTLFSSWENAQDISRANLLFENRNKSYGGYFIRVYYPERIFRAFIYAVFGFGILTGGLFILSRNVGDVIVSIPPNNIYWADPPVGTPPTPPPPDDPPARSKRTSPSQGFTTPVAVDSAADADTTDKEILNPNPDTEHTATKGDSASAGENRNNNLPYDNDKPRSIVEIAPVFPGGDAELFKFFRNNIIYPPRARENNTQGYVYLTFVVDKRGKISDVKLLHGIGDGCEEEAIRVVKKMPDWIPGKMGGEPVAVQYNLPINFRLK